MCSGATAIRFALLAEWHTAVTFVVFAMIFDMLDGRAARMLGADTRFGAQLDSPGRSGELRRRARRHHVHLEPFERMGAAGWVAALIFCACSAIRLARFNVQSVRDEGASKSNPYFTGLPTPAAACMMLLPMLISFQWNGQIVREPWVVGVMIAITSALMVSRLPTPSIKHMRLSREHRLLAGLCGGILVVLLIIWPWATLTGGPFDLCRDHSRWRWWCTTLRRGSSALRCITERKNQRAGLISRKRPPKSRPRGNPERKLAPGRGAKRWPG